MRKLTVWAAVIALLIFIITWGVIGLRITNGEYEITSEAYLGVISLITGSACLIYLRMTASKCKHCGRMWLVNGRYCHHCGEEN